MNRTNKPMSNNMQSESQEQFKDRDPGFKFNEVAPSTLHALQDDIWDWFKSKGYSSVIGGIAAARISSFVACEETINLDTLVHKLAEEGQNSNDDQVENHDAMCNAVGSICLCLMHFCNHMGISFEYCIANHWYDVSNKESVGERTVDLSHMSPPVSTSVITPLVIDCSPSPQIPTKESYTPPYSVYDPSDYDD